MLSDISVNFLGEFLAPSIFGQYLGGHETPALNSDEHALQAGIAADRFGVRQTGFKLPRKRKSASSMRKAEPPCFEWGWGDAVSNNKNLRKGRMQDEPIDGKRVELSGALEMVDRPYPEGRRIGGIRVSVLVGSPREVRWLRCVAVAAAMTAVIYFRYGCK